MNITNFLITVILIGTFLTGSLVFVGDIFESTSYNDEVSPAFENMTRFSNSTINSISGDLYDSSKEITPVSSEGFFLKNIFTAGKIIIDSISSFKNIISELFMILGIPAWAFWSLVASLMVALILSVFWMIRGGSSVL